MPVTAIDQLKEHCSNYIRLKHIGGVKYEKQEGILNRFIKHCLNFDFEKNTIPKNIVLAWNKKDDNESARNHRLRINTIRAFLEYLSGNGVTTYIGDSARYKPSNFKPYIFTNDELMRFFSAADNCAKSQVSINRHLVMPLLFRLLYSCGLRVSEAVHLRVCDVDLKYGVLTILGTKFYKDRLIPVDASLLERLKIYSKQVLTFSACEAPFFPSPNNKFYSTNSIYNAFRDILWKAGISHGGKGNGPRVHDFRHTFAVRCLKKWVLAGDDLSVALPYLSTFMGHDGIYHTQVYLRLTSDLYPDIVSKMESHFDVLPELGGIYETN